MTTDHIYGNMFLYVYINFIFKCMVSIILLLLLLPHSCATGHVHILIVTTRSPAVVRNLREPHRHRGLSFMWTACRSYFREAVSG